MINTSIPHGIGEALRKLIESHIEPSAEVLIALSGPQGSGKTTSTQYLKSVIGDDLAVLALDDFYLTLKERKQLAIKKSPLLKTRGVPGTHDVKMLLRVIKALQCSAEFSPVKVPVFNKSTDDRIPETDWPMIKVRPRIIVVEGWCMGFLPPHDFLTGGPVNQLERQDTNNAWRNYQIQSLNNDYLSLWAMFDKFVHIRAQSFDIIKSWRTQQEASNLNLPLAELSNEKRQWVDDFIQYYERITTAMIAGHHIDGSIVEIDENRIVMTEPRGKV